MSDTSASTDIVYVGFLTGHGGDAVQMLQLAHGMQRLGRRVRVIVPEVETSVGFAQLCAELGVECERSDLIRADMSGPRQDIRSMLRLARSVRAPVLHFHTGNSVLPRSLHAALAIARAPRAFATVHSPYETIDPGSGRARFWARAVQRQFHAVVSPSGHGTSFQRRCGVPEAQALTIRNAIDVDAIAEGDGSRPRAELGLGPDDPLVVFTSRIESQKRPADAVRIFAGVAADHPSAHLVFVGTGDLVPEARRVAASAGVDDRVHFVGHRDDVADWLAAATVWLLPTERENFSVAVLEALAASAPVLSTMCPGNDEVLVDGGNSLTFAPGDVAGGTEALRRLLGSAALRAELSTRGRADALEFSVDRMVEHYHDAYLAFGALPRRSG